jgi:nucleotide-binding universal stress UspA family protein
VAASVITTILVPVDGSACATHALAYACDFSKIASAKIELCYAVDYHSLPGSMGKRPESAPDLLLEEGESILMRARAAAGKRGVEARCRLIRGNAAEAIVQHARESNADLIIMGTHGRTGFRRLVLGSVADGVARRSSIPVLLMREETR